MQQYSYLLYWICDDQRFEIYNFIYKYMTLLLTSKSKEIIQKYEEFWNKFRYLISSIIKNSDDYDEKYKLINYNSDSELPLIKTIKIHNATIVVRAFFMKITNIICKFS